MDQKKTLKMPSRLFGARLFGLPECAGWLNSYSYCCCDPAAEMFAEVSNPGKNVSVEAVSLLLEHWRRGLWFSCFALWRLWYIGFGAVSNLV